MNDDQKAAETLWNQLKHESDQPGTDWANALFDALCEDPAP